MKTIKQLNIFLVIPAILVSFSSCEEMLDVNNPNSITTNDFWKSPKDANYAVNAIYATLNGQPADLRISDLLNRTDEMVSYYGWADAANFYNNKVPLGVGYDNLYNSWPFNETYASIYQINQAIAKIPAIDMDQTLKDRYIAEVKFIRAYHYINLVTLWGNIPYADAILGNQSAGYPSRSIPELWELIEADLTFAKDNLPVEYSDAIDKSRITKGAAKSLLAKAFMQQHKWSNAKDELSDVITSAKYSLIANYHDNFTHYNEFNSESIFEIPWMEGASPSGSGEHTSVQAQVYSPVGGHNEYEATPKMIDEFNLSAKYYNNNNADSRRDITFIWNGMNPSIQVYGTNFAGLESHSSFFLWAGDGISNHAWIRKNLNDYWNTGENGWSGINRRKIRYADVLLMYAECLINTGAASQAYQYINIVRKRAGVQDLTPTNLLADIAKPELTMHGYTIPTDEQGKMQIQIEYERIWELTGEQTRFFDLVRWGYFESTAKLNILSFTDRSFKTFTIGRDNVLPIPSVELDNNPGVTQNPGY